jgi:hypothetical protein
MGSTFSIEQTGNAASTQQITGNFQNDTGAFVTTGFLNP